MTVNELCDNLSIQSPLKILSAYNGKVLCYDFKPGNEKHKEIGERKIDTLWAEMRFTKSSGFGNYADSVLCAFVDGYPEHEKALKEAQPCASIGALRSRGNAVRAAEFLQGLDVALSALLPVTREQVEKVWRGSGCFRFLQIRRTQTTFVASAPNVGVSKLRLQGIGFAHPAAPP